MITFIVLSKNNEKTIKKTFESTQGVGEVLLIDTGSTDATLSIARSFPHVTVHSHPFTNYGDVRNYGASLAQTDWIFALDSDEELTDALKNELDRITLEKGCAYRVSSKNFYRKKRIKHSGWSPDYKFRLYNRNDTCFTERKVHENLDLTSVKTKTLRSSINHYSYHSAAELLIKMDRYSSLFAEEFAGRKKSSILKALYKSQWAFLKTYLLQLGFLDGAEGILIAKYNAETTFYKYLKLAEKNRHC